MYFFGENLWGESILQGGKHVPKFQNPLAHFWDGSEG